MAAYTLFGRPGWGSAIVEAQLSGLGLAFDYAEVPDLFTSDAGRSALAQHNPLPQVPTLLLPDGSVMTESAAITLHLADATARSDFVPPAGHATRPAFLRWLVFLVANIYPTFTYADVPTRFVPDMAAAQAFRTSVDAYQCRLWGIAESAAGAPWFLGDQFSALDVYIATMSHWRPGKAWFVENTPSLDSIARRVCADSRFSTIWEHNFPNDLLPQI